MSGPILRSLTVADPPEHWRELGFQIDGEELVLDGVRLVLTGGGGGIIAWSIAGLSPDHRSRKLIDGLPTIADPSPPADAGADDSALPAHPNGAIALDHVVIITPQFDRTAAALDDAGMRLSRIRDAGFFRQGFRRIGPTILELVEARQMPAGPAGLWGIAVSVIDLEALAERLGPERLSEPKAAVQPGRRIATVRRGRGRGISTALAFMTPEPPR